MSKALGIRILKTLQQNGQTQKELAERIGITEPVLSRYISGERDPKPETLANIATALRTTSDYLLGIEMNDFNYPHVKRIIARNASAMSIAEKKELIEALFGEE